MKTDLINIAMTCEKVHKYRTEKVSYYSNRIALVFHLSVISTIIYIVFAAGLAQADPLISVPAEYVADLRLPGSIDHYLRPARILVDSKASEIYVADAGNNRITILDQNGLFKFQFYTTEHCGAPSDVAVNAEGHIFVLGSTAKGAGVFEYDYNGTFLRQLSLDSLTDKPQIGSFSIDNQGRLYCLDEAQIRLIRFSADGAVDKVIPVANDLSEKLRHEMTFGAMTIANDIIYLPASSIGSVYCYDLDGTFIRMIGYQGTKAGELNFPVAVAVTADHLVMVLDKHRYNVLCYTTEGKFLGEFGGKGISAGWFFHPTGLAVDDKQLAYVGQIFNNKIQVCRIPAAIIERLAQPHSSVSVPKEPLAGSSSMSGQLKNKSQDQHLSTNYINQLHGGTSHA